MRERSMITWGARALAGLLVCACQTADHAPGAPLPVDSAVPDSIVTSDSSLPPDASVLPDVQRNLIAAGFAHTCMLRDDGSPVCWGAGGPNDPIDHQRHVGQSTVPTDERFTEIVAGSYHSCGLREDGTIHCWGQASAIEDTPEGSFRWIAAHTYETCALDASGLRTCWGGDRLMEGDDRRFVELALGGGRSHCGKLITGETECSFGDQPYPDVPQDVSRLSGESLCFCGIDSEGHAVCWGPDCHEIQPGTQRVEQLALGVTSLCAINEARGVTCWGQWHSPALRGAAVSLVAGYSHACARVEGGKARCWGRDLNGSTQPPPDLIE